MRRRRKKRQKAVAVVVAVCVRVMKKSMVLTRWTMKKTKQPEKRAYIDRPVSYTTTCTDMTYTHTQDSKGKINKSRSTTESTRERTTHDS